jgi:hypothetical protein
MKILCTVLFTLIYCYTLAQPITKFQAFVIQGNDTLDVKDGLINFDPIHFCWTQNPAHTVKSVDVTFGNGAMAYSVWRYEIQEGLNFLDINLEKMKLQEAAAAHRKDRAPYSRIVITARFADLESNKVPAVTTMIPFKIRKP